MAYTDYNYKTKKALKEAFKAGEKIHCFQPGGMFPLSPVPGTIYLEGPHYPQAHTWYTAVEVDSNAVIVRIKS